MRRKEKEIVERRDIISLIKKCQVCRVGLAKDNQPYIVPVSFGFDGEALYFHTVAGQGMKVDYISANKQVCFEFEHGVRIVSNEDKPCDWSFHFQSVIGFGYIEELQSREKKVAGLSQIMAQYSNKQWDFNDIPLKAVSVWKITINSMTGKQSLNFVEQS